MDRRSRIEPNRVQCITNGAFQAKMMQVLHFIGVKLDKRIAWYIKSCFFAVDDSFDISLQREK